MARRPTADKKPTGKAPKKAAPSGGSGLPRLLFYVAILAGVGYAASRLPIGGRTALEHLRDAGAIDRVQKTGAELGRAASEAVRKATGSAPANKAEPAKKSEPARATTPEKPAPPAKTPAPPPVKPDRPAKATRVASVDKAPADEVTREERRALDDLLR